MAGQGLGRCGGLNEPRQSEGGFKDLLVKEREAFIEVIALLSRTISIGWGSQDFRKKVVPKKTDLMRQNSERRGLVCGSGALLGFWDRDGGGGGDRGRCFC